MKPETESSVSKAKTEKKTRGKALSGSTAKRKTARRSSASKSGQSDNSVNESANVIKSQPHISDIPATAVTQKHVSDLEFLDTVKETVYKKLLDNELDLKIDSGFKAIELKNKISDTSENERLLLEILSEIRSEELSKS
jgi:hypothetical protein